MKDYSIQSAKELYGIDGWGNQYFDIDKAGFLTVSAGEKQHKKARVSEMVKEVKKEGLQLPLLLRFPQILGSQVNQLADAFDRAIKEYKYTSDYCPAFPIKVNQRWEVVQPLMNTGYKRNLGIEVGSKPELCAALGIETAPESVFICNGFKDQEYMELASIAKASGRNVMIVIEKPFELETLLHLKKKNMIMPGIGFRIKLNAKGSGFWQKSGGHASKFGLSVNQLLVAIELLRKNDILDHLKLFHFHIGSQITEIRRIKDAIKEGARIYAKVKKMGIDLEYLNVGGGLGIDYDGSKTSSDASVNYSVKEYANDVVYSIKEVCESEGVDAPKIVTESGRYLVAYHSMLIVDVRDQYHEMHTDKPEFTGKESQVIEDMLYMLEHATVKNYREFYHDCVEKKEEMNSLFNLGMLDLEDRAKGEWIYWTMARKAVEYSKTAKYMADEFQDLQEDLHEKVVGNFSVFQSLPDHWALDQLFPVMPTAYLNQYPARKATIVDITCDSDGEIEKFVDLKDTKSAIEIHDTSKLQPYYLAFLMVGAYQDTMGDLHNLFGTVDEAQVMLGESGTFTISGVKKGDRISDALGMFGYVSSELVKVLKQYLDKEIQKGTLDTSTSSQVLDRYQSALNSYPYLVNE